jgi:crotonobetainyl-CoA:carnitine CoA-transferase CaiB-like acyl-CoA transferase
MVDGKEVKSNPGNAAPAGSAEAGPDRSYLGGFRVLEIGDEQGEFCGRLLANLGADVIKIEPPDGSPTRRIGPFLDDNADDHEKSLYFWHYNLGKRSVVLDLDSPEGCEAFRKLVRIADVVVDSCPPGYLDERDLSLDALSAVNPELVHASITPFGRTGPWAAYQSSDLVHLALGGQMMYCGYDAGIDGQYDTPPIAPQMWQAYHMAGDHAAMGIMAALLSRDLSGVGQRIDVAVHQVVSSNTELDVPYWIYQRKPMSRHVTNYSMTKDGRYLYPLHAYPADGHNRIVRLLEKYGMAGDLADEKYTDPLYRMSPDVDTHIQAFIDRFISRYKFEGPWLEAQDLGLLWAPMRKPEESLDDPHWTSRQTFLDVEHHEVGETFRYPVGRWYSEQADWAGDRRAPYLGEHTQEVLASVQVVRTNRHPEPGRA